jgi:outer membrane protein assembly factor BamB
MSLSKLGDVCLRGRFALPAAIFLAACKSSAPAAPTVPVAPTAAGSGIAATPGGAVIGTTAGAAAIVGTGGQTGVAAAQSGAGATPPGATPSIPGNEFATAGTGAPGVPQAGTAAPQAGSGGPPPTGGVSKWTMIAYDVAGTYNNSAETVLTKDNAASLTMAWQVDMGTNVYGAPLQIGDKIYASSATGVKQFDAATGTPGWTGRTGTTGSMAFDSGTLYLNTTSGAIVALDVATGMQKWSKTPMGNPGGDGSSSPVVAGNSVFIGGSDGAAEILGGRFRGYLAALDKTTGDGLWTSFTVPTGSAGASMWNSAAVDLAAQRVFGATGNNHGTPMTDTSDSFIAFDYATGDIKWKNQRTMGDTWSGGDTVAPDADFGASPVLYDTMVGGVLTKLISAGQKIGDAHAVKRDDGMLLWTRKLCTGMNTRDGKLGIFVNSAWSGKNMLFACNKEMTSQLFGLDGATGEIAWMTPLTGEVYGRISAANGVGFVGAGANLVVFDTDTGKIIKMVPSKGGTVAGTITIANGRVAYGEGLAWANGVSGRTLTVLKVQ